MTIVVVKVLIQIDIAVIAKALAADFEGDHLFIREGGGKASLADALLGLQHFVFVTDQTVHSNDKIIPIHERLLPVALGLVTLILREAFS
jgi:hypothetical protein